MNRNYCSQVSARSIEEVITMNLELTLSFVNSFIKLCVLDKSDATFR